MWTECARAFNPPKTLSSTLIVHFFTILCIVAVVKRGCHRYVERTRTNVCLADRFHFSLQYDGSHFLKTDRHIYKNGVREHQSCHSQKLCTSVSQRLLCLQSLRYVE